MHFSLMEAEKALGFVLLNSTFSLMWMFFFCVYTFPPSFNNDILSC